MPQTIRTLAIVQNCRRLIICMTLVLASSSPLFAQRLAEEYTPEQLHKHFQNVAEEYVMTVDGTRLSLKPQPLMHWQNTVRLQEQGALYMWQRNGRPQVLGSIFTFQNQGRVQCRHEMISLAESPLSAKLDGVTVWSPKKAGVEWTKFETPRGPTESAPRRLTQMRGIARQFTGTLDIPTQQIASLTLIPQPLVRYSAVEDDVIDGAVFSLAVVTDPEILLMIEARKSSSGDASWHYAAARAHYHAVELKNQEGRSLWKAPMVIELENTRANQRPHSLDPYFIFFPPDPLPSPELLQ